MSDKRVEGAMAMQRAAQEAADKGKEVVLSVVEEMLPDSEPGNPMRQVGAAVTAVSAMYGAILEACMALTKASPKEKQGIINLAAGMFSTQVAEGLMRVLNAADDDCGVAVVTVSEDGHGLG